MKKKITILLTCAGGDLSVQNIKLFKKSKVYEKINIIGVDTKKTVVAKYFLDKYYQVPAPQSRRFIKVIKKIIKDNHIDLILAGSDEESLILTKLFSNIKNIKVANSNYVTLKILSNKIRTYEELEKNKIQTPLWSEIRNLKDLKKKFKFFKMKKINFCIKPAISRGGRDVYIIDDSLSKKVYFQNSREIHLNSKIFFKEAIKYLKRKFPLMIMERLKGPVYDLDILSDKGKLITAVVRKRINSALPNEGHLIIKNNKLEKLAATLSKIFNLNYLHDCDLMLDKNNKFKILEINPRPSGSFSIGAAAGYPLIDNILKLHKGEKIKKIKNKIKKKIVPYKELLSI